MKRIAILFLLMCLPAWAAYTEHYVTATGSDTWANSATITTPCSLATAFANATAADRVNIKAGSYSQGAVTLTNPGTAVSMVTYRGYNSSIGDLDLVQRNTDGTLNTTNFPVITVTGIIQPLGYTNFKNLSFTGALSSVLLGNNSADDWGLISCTIVNSQNHASASCVQFDNSSYLIGCDLTCSGPAHGYIVDSDETFTMVGCRVKTTANSNMLQCNEGVVLDSVFIGNTATPVGSGFVPSAWTGTNNIAHGNTFIGLDTAIKLPNAAPATQLAFIGNNHVTDCTTYINSLYSGTANTAIIEYYNRTRDNGTARTGIGDGVLQGEIASGTTGDPTTDFVASASANYHLLVSSPGWGKSIMGGDIGAHQYTTTPPTAGAAGGDNGANLSGGFQ
jgi:hypothetical protein